MGPKPVVSEYQTGFSPDERKLRTKLRIPFYYIVLLFCVI